MVAHSRATRLEAPRHRESSPRSGAATRCSGGSRTPRRRRVAGHPGRPRSDSIQAAADLAAELPCSARSSTKPPAGRSTCAARWDRRRPGHIEDAGEQQARSASARRRASSIRLAAAAIADGVSPLSRPRNEDVLGRRRPRRRPRSPLAPLPGRGTASQLLLSAAIQEAGATRSAPASGSRRRKGSCDHSSILFRRRVPVASPRRARSSRRPRSARRRTQAEAVASRRPARLQKKRDVVVAWPLLLQVGRPSASGARWKLRLHGPGRVV